VGDETAFSKLAAASVFSHSYRTVTLLPLARFGKALLC
jgi:hypothetical protein